MDNVFDGLLGCYCTTLGNYTYITAKSAFWLNVMDFKRIYNRV